MTDERKALCKQSIDYADGNIYTCPSPKKRDMEYYKRGLFKGYKDGLAESKPKWHDLRKNPEDLPKENGKYIIHIKVTERMSITDTCDFFNGSFGRYINPVAWCELPKFEEKAK